jgi:formate/nitrite transporter FocA (FNT family)
MATQRPSAEQDAERQPEDGAADEALDIAKELIEESAQALGEAEARTEPQAASPLGAIPVMSRVERREVVRRTAISAVVVYEAVREEGERELRRTARTLMWSALAAGLSMGFSMVSQGLLAAGMPNTAWRPLVDCLGYSVGFLIVVLGRQQLFTENTLTAILPLLAHPNRATFFSVLRLWAIVLAANLLGAFIFATIVGHTELFPPHVQREFVTLGENALRGGFGLMVLRGIFAGWLIALMVWLLPGAEMGRLWIIIILTYVVALGNFAHIIAGSVEVLYLVSVGAATWATFLGGFMVPTLVGNIIGGVSLVAALNFAQVAAENDEMSEERR